MSASKQNTPATPTTNPKSRTVDGGLTALGGFFLQFVGTVDGTITDFWVTEDADSAPDTDKNTLFGVEIADSDAYSRQITSDGRLKLRLVQFKFSLKPDAETVTPKDLAEILDKMQKWVDKRFADGASEGRLVEVEFIMATNRPQSRDMEKLWSNRSNLSHSIFSTYSYDEYPDYHQNLQKCRWHEVHSDECRQRLQNWGREFGLTETQIDEGTLNLTNQFTARVAEGRRLFTLEEVEKVFTGCDASRRLNSPETREAIHDEIQRFIQQLRVPLISDRSPVTDEKSLFLSAHGTRKSITEELQKAINERALVIMTGDGGNGKSTLLATLLKSWAEKQFVSGTNLSLLADDWIIGCVERWRGEHRRLDNEPWQAVSRLLRFKDEHPVLLLALDALDENQKAREKGGELSRLLLFFAQEEARSYPPRVTLIVTCRKREDLNQFLGESGNELFASEETKNPGKEIVVEPFSTGDLLFLLEQKVGDAELLGGEVRLRLLASLTDLPLSNSLQSSSITLLSTTRSDPQTMTFVPPIPRQSAQNPVDAEVLKALQHPIVWGSFCRALNDDDIQNAALDGDSEAWGQVSKEILNWFSRKCEKRCSMAVSIDEVREVLLHVAAQCGEFSSSYTSKEWRNAANNVASATAIPTAVLRQAISSGLVTGNPQNSTFLWQWRHPFLVRYLRAQALDLLV